MPNSYCDNCDQEFAYDVSLGLNVKYYPTEVSGRGFRIGGDSPICPRCDARCETAEAIKYNRNKITFGRMYIPIKY